MHLDRVLVVTVVVLLTITSALVVPQEDSVSHALFTGRDGVNQGRSLRLTQADENDSSTIQDRTDAEERANLISTFFSKIGDHVPLSWKTRLWLERSKPVDYVKEKLGMKGLTGARLMEHENYPRLVWYADTLEGYKIWKLVRRDYTTTYWWDRKGLDQMVSAKKDMTNDEIFAQLNKIKATPAFKSYKRYAVEFDDHIINMFGSGYYRPTRFIDENATPVEKMARTQIWVEKERPPEYVKEFLGLLRADATELKKNQFY
ncbi:hypothetical protein F442_10193, partial [Phytophthora nicotianae P10297]